MLLMNTSIAEWYLLVPLTKEYRCLLPCPRRAISFEVVNDGFVELVAEVVIYATKPTEVQNEAEVSQHLGMSPMNSVELTWVAAYAIDHGVHRYPTSTLTRNLPSEDPSSSTSFLRFWFTPRAEDTEVKIVFFRTLHVPQPEQPQAGPG